MVATEGSTSDWTRAALPLVVLALLAEGESHGYALLQRLHAMGFSSVKGGTIYPLLARQQEHGWVGFGWQPSPSGPDRKMFFLTPAGTTELAATSTNWRRLVDGINKVLPAETNRGT